ncbi:MAG: N-acetylmuramoyl-L-alanine amidase [Chloroflexota bacterium]|nr:N-acetylmuramoyl-L-alanine amidase [Chloroflexota bacterium]
MPQLAKYIFGIHDPDGAGIMTGAGKPGWILASAVVTDPGGDFSGLANQGVGVIVRLNNGYGSDGTLPNSSQYDAFAQRCASYVAGSRGAKIWIIGNETNLPFEWPGNNNGSGGEPITPDRYAQCFAKCRAAIKQVPGHADDWVVPSPPAPWNNQLQYPTNPSGDWVKYFQDILTNCIQQRQPPDALALHTYTHGNTADLIASEQKMNAPFQNYHSHFRTYRDFLSVVPAALKSVAVFITESQAADPTWWQNQNTGWVQAAYKEINDWNAVATNQPIQAVCLFRWQTGDSRWSIADKRAVQDDFRAAMQNEYLVRAPSPQPAPPPPPPPQPQPPVGSITGWCPFTTKRPINANNFDVGRSGRKVTAVVLHIAAGSMAGVFPTFNDPNRLASAHFCVGKDGRIEQYVSIDDTAYGVGMRYKDGNWYNPRGILAKPTWAGLQPPYNPNMYTISVEHEGQPEDPWTPQMYDANNRLLQWIAKQINLTYVPRQTLIGHFEIDPVDRPNCPGPNVQWDQIAADANGAPTPDTVLTEIQATANEVAQLSINTQSALYRFAMANNLGNPQTNEFQFPVGNDAFIGQVYNFGIVYVKQGDWGNVAWAKKPDGAPAPSGPAAAAAVAAAQQQTLMPINVNSGFYKYARANNLGDPQSDEFDFTVDDDYRGQVYLNGFVYAKKSNLGNIMWVKKMDS